MQAVDRRKKSSYTLEPEEQSDNDSAAADASESLDAWERRLCARQRNEYIETAARNGGAVEYNAAQSGWALRSVPETEEEWQRVCFERYEDICDLLRTDPFLVHRFPPSQPISSWRQVYEFMDACDRGMLDSKRAYVPVQRMIRLEGRSTKVQDLESIFVIGLTQQYALIAAAIIADPDVFRLFAMRIDSIDPPRCEMMRRKQMLVDGLHDTQLEKDVNSTVEVSLDNVSPVWELAHDSKLLSVPITAALDPISGMLALLCEKQLDRLLVFDVHNRIGPSRISNIHLPCEQPDLLAISAQFIAVGYHHIQGRPKEATEVDSKPIPLPPHLYVARLDVSNFWRAYVVKRPEPPGRACSSETCDVAIHSFTHLSFHRTRPDLLVMGTEDGGLRMLNCAALLDTGTNELELESRATFYPGESLLEVYERYRVQASSQTNDSDAATVLFDMPSPKQEVWSASWTETENLLTGVREPRITMCLAETLAVVNASAELAQHKIATLGKKPVLYSHRGGPSLCCEARAGYIVIHDAFTNYIMVGELGRGRPCWKFDHPDVVGSMPPYRRAYQSLMVFTRRIVVLWPNGFVGFVEIADDAMLKVLEAETEKRVTERLEALTLNAAAASSTRLPENKKEES